MFTDSLTQNNEGEISLNNQDLGFRASSSPDHDEKTQERHLSDALQVEKDFLDFMFSLPQVQREGSGKRSKNNKSEDLFHQEQLDFLNHQSNSYENECYQVDSNNQNDQSDPSSLLQGKWEVKMRYPKKCSGRTGVMGLDRLDNLCKMMEQLGELRENNLRLQQRVQYLEDLKFLQEMHRDMQITNVHRKDGASLGHLSLSHSQLQLDEMDPEAIFTLPSVHSIAKGKRTAKNKLRIRSYSMGTEHVDDFLHSPCNPEKNKILRWSHVKEALKWERASILPAASPWFSKAKETHHTSDSRFPIPSSLIEEGILSQYKKHNPNTRGNQLLEVPDTQPHLHSSSEEDRKSGQEKEETGRGQSKDKKGHKSAWGKMKNIISYSKRDSIRKKSSTDSETNQKLASSIPKSASLISCASSMQEFVTATNWDASDDAEYEMDNEAKDQECCHTNEDTGIWMGPTETTEGSDRVWERLDSKHKSKKLKPQLTITVPSNEDLSVNTKNCKVNLDLSTPPPSPKANSNWMKKKLVILPASNLVESAKQKAGNNQIKEQSTTLLNKNFHSPEPSSPSKRKLVSTFSYDGNYSSGTHECEPSSALSPQDSPSDISIKTHAKRHNSIPSPDVQQNIDLERTDEFGKGPQEKSKGQQGSSDIGNERGTHISKTEENLPQDFKKKLHEWEKVKGKEKYRLRDRNQNLTSTSNIQHYQQHNENAQENLKMKRHDEDDLSPDFKKKLTEWEIRKALAGKGQPNVDKLQKNLGEDFNKKMEEWERIKTLEQKFAGTTSAVSKCISTDICISNERETSGFERKGSSGKSKKSKTRKPSLTRPECSKQRDKELLWLEKELGKIEREKQRLEREKEKFLEREARLEKMRQAMNQGPTEKKEIFIKTSTGEFRFEGINQTFTKRLYEWEERRGISPESSVFVLLDPNYKAPEKDFDLNVSESPEAKRIVRSRSESSIPDIAVSTRSQSTLSLNDVNKEAPSSLQNENKSASEPTFLTEDSEAKNTKCAVIVQLEEVVDELPDNQKRQNFTLELTSPFHPYVHSEITKLIDSSESDETFTCNQHEAEDDITVLATNNIQTKISYRNNGGQLIRSDSQKSEENYRSLLQENMTLLGKLKEQESLCRALENQMGDIDSKMDNVADQHFKTLEKLHRQVDIMKRSESSSKMSEKDNQENFDNADDAERNQRLIEQLKSRIVELESKGDKLMKEKEELETAFKLHKEQESQIAESLLLRIRELQDAEVNIQTVQCQTDDALLTEKRPLSSEEQSCSRCLEKVTHSCTPPKRRRRRRKEEFKKANFLDADDSDYNTGGKQKDGKEPVKRKKKTPSYKVQKLHNLTADLLLQAKRLEAELVTDRNMRNEEVTEGTRSQPWRKRSLRGQSSLRLPNEELSRRTRRKLPKDGRAGRSWSSIETIAQTSLDKGDPTICEAQAEAQDLLAMNAELSRMAKELRREMTNLWNFKESTSPDSNSSDNREVKRRISSPMNDKQNSRENENLCKSDRNQDLFRREDTSPCPELATNGCCKTLDSVSEKYAKSETKSIYDSDELKNSKGSLFGNYIEETNRKETNETSTFDNDSITISDNEEQKSSHGLGLHQDIISDRVLISRSNAAVLGERASELQFNDEFNDPDQDYLDSKFWDNFATEAFELTQNRLDKLRIEKCIEFSSEHETERSSECRSNSEGEKYVTPTSKEELRTRRISDTQVAYKVQKEYSPLQTEDRDALYKEKYSYYKKIGRTPSNLTHRSESNIPDGYVSEGECNNIFVKTQRTIFTVSGEGTTNSQSVIPTFLYGSETPSGIGTSEDSLKDLNTKKELEQENNDIVWRSKANVPFRMESKREVLEAVNKISPNVEHMIEEYNKRISEKQLLLMNPFSFQDPYQTLTKSFLPVSCIPPSDRKEALSEKDTLPSLREIDSLRKASSASVIPNWLQSERDKVKNTYLLGAEMLPENEGANLQDLSKHPSLLPPTAISNNAADGEPREIRLKKAKEEFLARGSAPLSMNYYGTAKKVASINGVEIDRIDGATTSENGLGTAFLAIPRNESFRRQSEVCFRGEQPAVRSIKKATSSDIVERIHSFLPRFQSSKSSSQGERKWASKGILKMFKLPKFKDKNSSPIIQQFIRQTLTINLTDSSSTPDPEIVPTEAQNEASGIVTNEMEKLHAVLNTSQCEDFNGLESNSEQRHLSD